MRSPAALAALMLCAGCALPPPQAEPLERSDPHVAELFNVLRATLGAGDPVDMDKLEFRLREMGRAHAVEWESEQALAEAMMLHTGREALAAARTHPEILDSLDAFNRAIGAW
ncbi:MAG: hypothetical protein B7Y90_05180 [Alphaproteobacteria bacterium 32-64-14]|nr:MAG: hypothetical protein B7Y90_05180 [Alphaproteobacteria bacterium 32-64-14]